ncbi:hypothetical protein AAZX31_05G057800 [Glycine max]
MTTSSHVVLVREFYILEWSMISLLATYGAPLYIKLERSWV